MTIYGFATAPNSQLKVLKKLLQLFNPFGQLATVICTLLWSASLLIITTQFPLWHPQLLTAAALTSALAVLVPRWLADISAEIKRLNYLINGRTQFEQQLRDTTASPFNLFWDVTMTGYTADAILQTPDRLVLVSFVVSEQTTQCTQTMWHRRNSADQWEAWRDNPTVASAERHIYLKSWLTNHLDAEAPAIIPLIVWLGPAVIALEEPSTPIVWLAQPHALSDTIAAWQPFDPTSTDTHNRIQQLLKDNLAPADLASSNDSLDYSFLSG